MASDDRVTLAAGELFALAGELAELPPAPPPALMTPLAQNQRVLGELAAGPQQILLLVMGEFSTGKSTLINALLGRVVAPMSATIETGHLSHFHYGSPERAVVHLRSGREREMALESVESLLRAGNPESQALLAQIEWVDYYLDLDLLRDIALVDTPGLGSVQAHHEQLTGRYLDTAQAVLWVFDSGQAGTGTESAYLETLGSHRCVIGVINKADRVDEFDRPGVGQHIRELAHGTLREVVWVSARQALGCALDQQPWSAESGLPRLWEVVVEHVVQRQGLIAEVSRDGMLRDATCRLYDHVSRRQRDLVRRLDGAERVRQVLDQRSRDVALKAETKLLELTRALHESLSSEWDECCRRRGNDLDGLGQDAAQLCAPQRRNDLNRDLQATAQRLFDDEWTTLTAQWDLADRAPGAAPFVPLDGVAPPDSGDAVSDGLVGAGFGLAAGAVIAAASAAITVAILPYAAVIGAVATLGNMVKRNRQHGAAAAEVRRRVQDGLDRERQELDQYVRQHLLPSIEVQGRLVADQLGSEQTQQLLGGFPIERLQQSAARCQEIETVVRRVARQMQVDLRGVVHSDEGASEPDADHDPARRVELPPGPAPASPPPAGPPPTILSDTVLVRRAPGRPAPDQAAPPPDGGGEGQAAEALLAEEPPAPELQVVEAAPSEAPTAAAAQPPADAPSREAERVAKEQQDAAELRRIKEKLGAEQEARRKAESERDQAQRQQALDHAQAAQAAAAGAPVPVSDARALRLRWERLYRSTTVTDAAWRRIKKLPTARRDELERLVGSLQHSDRPKSRDKVVGTADVYEFGFDHDGRAYVRFEGARVVLLQVGAKGTQERDTQALRRQSPG
ncbi:MAG: dynamin family protein [Fimbriimonadaceae bacterium]|nr:dynamin family protein [Fimbriimonadaceae bacterium]